MKKYGKKWRKLEAEKKIIRERMQAKAGEPFSSARKRKIRCVHYGGKPGGFMVGWCYSLLVPISEEECMCSVCKKKFPIEKISQMVDLVIYLSDLGCVRDEEYFDRYSKLSQGLEPVYYRSTASGVKTDLKKGGGHGKIRKRRAKKCGDIK